MPVATRHRCKRFWSIAAIAVVAGSSMLAAEAMQRGTLPVRHVSVSIDRPVGEVYAFISNGDNLVQWATGLGTTFRRESDVEWFASGPLGTVRVRLPERNEYGVADQTVTLETGLTVHNPIRVVQNGSGSTVTFWLMRLPGVSEREFESDTQWVQRDLERLKALLEKQ